MNNHNQNIDLALLLQSLEDDLDAKERLRILEQLKNSAPTDEALLGAKMLLEENNWDYTVLKKVFSKTENRIEAIAIRTKQTNKRTTLYLKYAAVVIPFVAIAGYFLLNTSKSIDNYFVKESGLPNLMSTTENDWNKLMQFYKSNELEKAYTFSEEISKVKTNNDTVIYYQAVIAYDLHNFEVATKNFKKIEANKQSIFNFDAEFRLGFSLLKQGNKKEAKQLFEKVANSESPFNSDAATILKEVFN